MLTRRSSVSADQHRRGGGSALSAALHLQTGADWCRSQFGETLELLRLPGHQEHLVSVRWHFWDVEETTGSRDTVDVKDTLKKKKPNMKAHGYQRVGTVPDCTRMQRTDLGSRGNVIRELQGLCVGGRNLTTHRHGYKDVDTKQWWSPQELDLGVSPNLQSIFRHDDSVEVAEEHWTLRHWILT